MSKWTMVPLGKVIHQVSEPHAVHSDELYDNFGIYSYGRGLFHKSPIDGATTSARILYRVSEGQFIYSRLFAFEGAYGCVPKEFDGFFVSNEYPTFNCEPNVLDINFLALYFSRVSTWQQAAALTTGMGHRRQRIPPENLLRFAIPLPPIAEQRQIIQRVAALAAKLDDASRLIQQSDEGLAALCRSVLHDTSQGEPVPTPMSELVKLRQPDVAVSSDETYHFAGVYCFGGGVFVGQKKSGMEFAYPRLTRLCAGNFVYPKLMAWEGALAVVPPECDRLVVSTEFPVFEINQDRVLPEVLDVYFRSPSVWPDLSGSSTGTNVRRRRLNPADFLRYRMPLPNSEVQELLRQTKRRVDQINQEHKKTAAELAAMLPAILDREFRCELSARF